MKKLTALVASLLLVGALLTGQAEADDRVVIKVATVAPKGTPWSALMDRIKKRIKDKSGNAYKVKVYYGGRLGGEKETVRETRNGRIHMWGGSTAALATIVPELNALETPFLFESSEEADFVLDNYVRPEVEKLLAARGFVLYQFAENGWHGIGLKDGCVTGPESLSGKKVRSQEATVHLETFKALGANPVAMSVPEVLPALKQGTVDGFSNTPLFAFATSWYQGIKFFTPTRHVYQPGVLVYSKEWFDKQDAALQKLLLDSYKEDQEFGRSGVRKIEKGLIDNFTRADIKVCEISDSQRAALKAKTTKIFGQFKKKSGKRGRALYSAIEAGKKAWAAGKR